MGSYPWRRPCLPNILAVPLEVSFVLSVVAGAMSIVFVSIREHRQCAVAQRDRRYLYPFGLLNGDD
jgi:hypothetical protein